MESLSIRHPEWLQVLKDGRHSFGYNQEWYHDEWQRVSGCGPTTATQVISYVEFRDGYLNTADSSDGEAALKRMETLWHYVRPRIGGGLYKTHWLENGLTDYIKEQNMPYEVKMISIYPFSMCRPSLQQVKEFIRRGLSEDSPVAFLNRHRGHEEALSTWHWVPIIKIADTADDVLCTVYDEEEERTFSLAKWLRDTMLGGGFAYVHKATVK